MVVEERETPVFPASHDREIDDPFLEPACEHSEARLYGAGRWVCDDCGLRWSR